MITNTGLKQDIKTFIGVIGYTLDDKEVLTYGDVYTFDMNQYMDDPKKYIRRDLKAIASDCGRQKLKNYNITIKVIK